MLLMKRLWFEHMNKLVIYEVIKMAELKDNVLLEVFTAFSFSVKASNFDRLTRAQHSEPSRKQ